MENNNKEDFESSPYTKASYTDNKGNVHSVAFTGSLSYCNAKIVSMLGTLSTEANAIAISITMVVFILLSKFGLLTVSGIAGTEFREVSADISTILLLIVATNSGVRMPDNVFDNGSFYHTLYIFWGDVILSWVLGFMGMDALESWLVMTFPFALLYHAVKQTTLFNTYSLIIQQTEVQEMYGVQEDDQDAK